MIQRAEEQLIADEDFIIEEDDDTVGMKIRTITCYHASYVGYVRTYVRTIICYHAAIATPIVPPG